MFAYGIGTLLPFIHQLKAEFSLVEQPWYADDVGGTSATFDKIECFFRQLCEIGPSFGYCLEPLKSILIMHQHNVEAA
jgi:hypothetical protein